LGIPDDSEHREVRGLVGRYIVDGYGSENIILYMSFKAITGMAILKSLSLPISIQLVASVMENYMSGH